MSQTKVPPPKIKWCKYCRNWLPITDFAERMHTRDGYYHRCKVCERERNRDLAEKKRIAALEALANPNNQPQSPFMESLKKEDAALYYHIYGNKGAFIAHIFKNNPRLFKSLKAKAPLICQRFHQ